MEGQFLVNVAGGGFLGEAFFEKWGKAGYFWRVFWRVLAGFSFFLELIQMKK